MRAHALCRVRSLHSVDTKYATETVGPFPASPTECFETGNIHASSVELHAEAIWFVSRSVQQSNN